MAKTTSKAISAQYKKLNKPIITFLYKEDSQISGTVTGGIKARDSNKLRRGSDYYHRIGAIGGRKGKTGGFYANRELASTAGRKGGLISKRRPKIQKPVDRGEVIPVRIVKKSWWKLW